METRRIAKYAVATLLAALFAMCLCACASGQNESSSKNPSFIVGTGTAVVTVDESDLSGGVCADVNDAQIGENAVTAYINNFRYAMGLQDDGDWGQWLFDNGYTMDGMRAETVDYFVNQELIRQAASLEGVSVDEAEVDKAVNDVRESLGDEEFENALDAQGQNEDNYRKEVRMTLLQTALQEKVAPAKEVTDSDLLEQLKYYYPDDVSADATTLDGIDQVKVDNVLQMMKSYNAQQAFSDWMLQYKEKSKVVTHMMPDGLPYVIDLAPFEAAANAAQNNASSSADPSSSDSASSSSASEGA